MKQFNTQITVSVQIMHLYLEEKNLKRYSVSRLEVNDAEFVHQSKRSPFQKTQLLL